MKALELREMSSEQLQSTLKDTIDGLFRLRLQAQSERLEAPGEIRRKRRLIARIRTVFRERELLAANGDVDASNVDASSVNDRSEAVG